MGSCPELRLIYEKLEEKRLVASKYISIDGRRFTVNYNPVAKYFVKEFGRLATIHDTDIPQSRVKVMNTVIALETCLAMYRKERGELINEIIILEGAGGVGKSSLAAWIVKKLGGVFVSNTIDLVKAVKNGLENGSWYPILVIDDVASMVSKYWFMDKKERAWGEFFKLIEYSKDFSGVILITSRSFEGVAKRLREIAGLQAIMKTVYMKGGYLLGMIEYRRPGKKLPIYVDVYWPFIRMPEDFWEKTIINRRARGLEMINNLVKKLGIEEIVYGETS